MSTHNFVSVSLVYNNRLKRFLYVGHTFSVINNLRYSVWHLASFFAELKHIRFIHLKKNVDT